MFKEQPAGIASNQAAQQALQKTNTVFSALGVSQDSLIHQYQWASFGFAGHFSKLQVDLLRKNPLVDHVVKDFYYKAIDTEPSATIPATKTMASGSQNTPWGVSSVGGKHTGSWPTAWVIDTGVDLDHPDLNVDMNRTVSFLENEGTDDGNGHGTHVSGIIAAIDNNRDVVGVAAGASVVGVKVCDSDGGCFVSDVMAGVDYAGNNFSSGDVANISLGYPENCDQFPEFERCDIPLSDLENSIINAANSGLKLTIAAGNDSEDADTESPARLENSNVWTVSAYDIYEDFASFSNFGNPPIEYGGPGVNIPSLWKGGGTNTISGTSMAAPHLAGLLLVFGTNFNTNGTVDNDPDGNPDPIPYGALDNAELTKDIQNDKAHFTWPAVANAERYHIYYYTNEPAANMQDFQKVSETTGTSYTGLALHSDRQGDPNYSMYSAQYKIVAVDENGDFNNSTFSNIVTFMYWAPDDDDGGGDIGFN